MTGSIGPVGSIGLIGLFGLALAWSAGGCRCGAPASGPARKGPAVVVVDPDELARADADPEREPNDTRASAQPLEPDKPVGGTVARSSRDGGAQADEDWYRVRVEGDRILSASLSGVAGEDLQLEAMSAEGRRLVKVDNHPEGGGEVLINLAVKSGSYYLRVRLAPRKAKKRAQGAPATPVAGRAGGSYRLSFRTRDRESGEELEPNWKAPWATELALGGEAVGYLGWHTDTDWYRVSLAGRTPGTLLRVEFDGVDGVAAHVSVHDSKSALVQRRSGRAGEQVALANLSVTPGTDTVFVVVRCSRQANVESQYALRVSAQVPGRLTEVEPNDVPARATPVPLGKVISGNLGGHRDDDFFAVVSDRPVSVVASPPAGVDIALALVGADGKVRWEVNAAPAGKSEALPVVSLAAPGTVLRVRAPGGSDADPLGTYRLLVKPRADAVGGRWEVEPNDAREQASSWSDGPLRGFLHPAKDVDHFALPCPETSRLLRVVAKRRPGRVELLGPDGRVLAGSPRVGRDGGLTLTLPAVAGGGRCLLRLAEGVGGTSEQDPYRLSLEAVAPGGG